jgi:hypothetical protein
MDPIAVHCRAGDRRWIGSRRIANVADVRRFFTLLLVVCACKPAAGSSAPGESTPASTPTDGASETLSAADIEAGLGPVKATAKEQCKALASGGELVKVTVVVQGPEGRVTAVEVVEFADNPKLARCYADALGTATFKKVGQAEIRIDDEYKF